MVNCKISDLSGGSVTLEFEDDDVSKVGKVIKEFYPEFQTKQRSYYSLCYFGGFEFMFLNEWEDPCLISSEDGGIEILKKLEKILKEK